MRSKHLGIVIVMVLCLGGAGAPSLAPTPALAQGGRPASDAAVSSTLSDAGDVTLSTNNRLQSDGSGAYFNGVSSVESIIQGALGDWVVDTSGSASRSVLVDFRDPVAGSSTSNAPFNWQLVKARLISKCSLTQSGGYLNMTAGSTINCPLHAAFTFGGVSYRLTMNPLNDGATSYAQVSCNAVNGAGQCNNWSVVPVTQPDSSVRGVAVLLCDTKVKGKTITTNQGYFYMTFQIGITRP